MQVAEGLRFDLNAEENKKKLLTLHTLVQTQRERERDEISVRQAVIWIKKSTVVESITACYYVVPLR